MSNVKCHNAFTLIELLIVVGIVTVLAAVGIMNLLNYTQRQDLDFTAREIVSVLRNAQNRSVSQEDGLRWGVYFENPAAGTDFYDLFKGATYSGGTLVSRATLRSGVQFVIPATGATSTIIFSPATGLPTASTTVKISLVSNSAASSTITINANGGIQY